VDRTGEENNLERRKNSEPLGEKAVWNRYWNFRHVGPSEEYGDVTCGLRLMGGGSESTLIVSGHGGERTVSRERYQSYYVPCCMLILGPLGRIEDMKALRIFSRIHDRRDSGYFRGGGERKRREMYPC